MLLIADGGNFRRINVGGFQEQVSEEVRTLQLIFINNLSDLKANSTSSFPDDNTAQSIDF